MNQGQQTAAATTAEARCMEDGPQRRGQQTTAMTAAASDDNRPQPGLPTPATPTAPIHNGLPPASTHPSAATTLITLPAELLLHTTTFLPDAALLSLSLTTRRLHHPLLCELYTRKSAPRSHPPIPQFTLHAAAAAAAAAATATRPPNTAAERSINRAVKAYLSDTALLEAFSTTPTTTATTTGEEGAATTTLTRDGITSLHRALHHALTTRQPRALALAHGLAPAGFVRARWVERALVAACCDRDVVFAEGLLMRFRGLLGGPLRSGRVVGAVLERAAELGGGRCFGGVVRVLLRFVVLDVDMDVDVDVDVDGGGVVDMREEERERRGLGLLEKVMLVGRHACRVHGVSEGLCFAGMVRLMVEKGMVDFTGVTRKQLEGWISALPEETGFIVEFLLASVSGSPLPRP